MYYQKRTIHFHQFGKNEFSNVWTYSIWAKIISFSGDKSIKPWKNVQGVQKKSALGKHLDIATHGFKMCILYFEKDNLGPNPSRPLKGHPWRHTISFEPIWSPKVLLAVTIVKYPKADFSLGHPVLFFAF